MYSSDFVQFYREIHPGRDAFPWQRRVAESVIDRGEWPEGIDVPTACGKTSLIDVAVFALAAQAGMAAKSRTARLRTFFVVDRRLVVDDVSAHAKHIATELESAKTGIVKHVADALREFGVKVPLKVDTLRGGMYRSDAWADAPNQPVVCVSTVDQIGSRLLFRGYGLSAERRPIDAGLAGNDSLVIIDEAHLSTPFIDTLRAIRSFRAKEHVGPGVQVLPMTATPREVRRVLRLEPEDYNCAALSPRLQREKRAELRETTTLEETAVEAALRLAKSPGVNVIGVVLNTVNAARDVFERLREIEQPAILLTGRIRPFDRDRLLHKYQARIKTGRDRTAAERLFVVATQTIEVGADLDFDALVTEIAPLDALRQRFGRLNRVGELVSVEGVVIWSKRDKRAERLYGPAVSNTWKWLNEHASKQGGKLSVDFGLHRMTELAERAGNVSLNSVRGEGPLLFPAHLDAWVQTNPAPSPDPDVAPFLHGEAALDTADVQIVWRADLDNEREREWVERVAAAQPLMTEAVQVPYRAARRWLAEQGSVVTDTEGVGDDEQPEAAKRKGLIWRGPERSTTRLWELRPGDTVIMPSVAGGCDEYGWNPDSAAPVPDIGDECWNQRVREGGGRYRLRVHPAILGYGDEELQAGIRELVVGVRNEEAEAEEKLESLLKSRIPDLKVDWGRPQDHGDSALIVLSKPKRVEGNRHRRTPEIGEDDTASLGHEKTLDEHTKGVVTKATEFARGCGLEENVAECIRRAAELHDVGKCDGRFQMILDPGRDPDDLPLAKGREKFELREYIRRRDAAGYPAGARHEFASVRLAEAAANGVADSELLLHLIGTHHGHGRALPPVWRDAAYAVAATVDGRAVSARVEDVCALARLDSGWVDRFWRLIERYGYWGLAYLETILRRADCIQSREEEEATWTSN